MRISKATIRSIGEWAAVIFVAIILIFGIFLGFYMLFAVIDKSNTSRSLEINSLKCYSGGQLIYNIESGNITETHNIWKVYNPDTKKSDFISADCVMIYIGSGNINHAE